MDFILNSADHVLRQEFGRSLSDEGVHVLDPFTGTGIFLVRLLQSALIRDSDLERKYHKELHANEIVVLAYYIAAIHIEEAFHGRRGPESSYEPFEGIVLTDTFNLHTDRTGFPKAWLPDNSARVERQQNTPIQVIIGNPPWSAGQRSAADDNPNVDYPEIEKRVAETYAVRSRSTNKNSLYDTYKMAIRWASDRIGDQGVVALVTNGSWIDGNVDSGIRACLSEEFSSIYVVNLRGNARTSGVRRRAEGDNVFGQGSRAPVAITILARNRDAGQEGCRIFYRDIGNHLKREEKLAILKDAESIVGVKNLQEIKPDEHHDWIDQRDEAFQKLYPVGSKAAKAGAAGSFAIFRLYSNGLKTGKDILFYNFSRERCAGNAHGMTANLYSAIQVREGRSDYFVDQGTKSQSSHVAAGQVNGIKMPQKKETPFSSDKIWTTQYRPFVKQHCYVDYALIQRKYQMDSIFPSADSTNRAICVPGISSTKPFSCLVVDTVPDLHLVEFGQCFPRFRYASSRSGVLVGKRVTPERIDNISDKTLALVRAQYKDNTITKDQIFDYVYGTFQAVGYRERFAIDLAKDLPRIPFAPDFHAFAKAGRALAELHLGYETCEEYPLEILFCQPGKPRARHFRLSDRAMKFEDDEKTTLRVNEYVSLRGIPAEAHRYQVNGRTPLEWYIDRYRITRDKQSGIVNDPNEWFGDPRDLVAAIRRIVHVSVETVRIVEGLPEAFEDGEV